MSSAPERNWSAVTVFDRVVCGVDLGSASRVAARQAAQLVNPDGSLLLVSATVGEAVPVAFAGGLGYVRARTRTDTATRERYCEALTSARHDAVEQFGGTRIMRVEGEPIPSLLDALGAERATLAVVGGHETQRLPGIVLGSVATHVLHKADCSVLVARGEWPEGRPRRVIVGVDGSPGAAGALLAARELVDRLGGSLEELTDQNPVPALVASARPDDLIVIGSRDLHGPRALGSVPNASHTGRRARCSSCGRPDGVSRARRNPS